MKRVVCSSTIEEAAANLSGAMEAETISKNGHSSKSQMSRGNYILVIVVVIFSMAACSGRSSEKILNGTWTTERYGNLRYTSHYTFSGNKYEYTDVFQDGETNTKTGTFKLDEEYKEKGFSRGVIIFNSRDGEFKEQYSLEGNTLKIGANINMGAFTTVFTTSR